MMPACLLLLFAAAAGASPALGTGQDAPATPARALEAGFADPPREFSMVPLWSWNSTLEPEEIRRQIDEMVDKGVYGAFMHARAGLESGATPYFSEGWWRAVDMAVEHGAAVGFHPWIYDEDKWPSGAAGGRTIARNPERNTQKALRVVEQRAEGPAVVELPEGKPVFVVAAQFEGDALIPDSSVEVTEAVQNSAWNCPEGEWLLSSYFFEPYGEGWINYLNRDTVRDFIDITHEEYARRYPSALGGTIPGVFFDEIMNEAGKKPGYIVWTETFQERFQSKKGYDLVPYLPALAHDMGRETPRLRCDYYDVYTALYEEAWFTQLSQWCAEHDLTLTGHTVEELNRYVTQGNYIRTQRHLQIPTTDNEDFRYTWPREIGPWKPKQVASIVHLYGQPRAGAEAMGGAGWCFTLDMARYGFNMLGAYGINFFVPHLFHYAQDMPANMDDWPNSWFFQNPYWKYFKTFADHGRRLSFMLTGGEPVVDVCVLYPETNLWSGYGPGNIQETIAALVARQVDADILDPDSLLRAEIADGALRACTAAYPILVVPGVQCLRRAEADKILAFAQAGGTVLLQDRWPTDSMEEGRDDPHMAEFREKMEAIGTQTSPFDATLDLIAQREDRDLIVTEGNPAALRYRHLQKEGKDIYWLVNGGRAKQEWLLDVRAAGAPELWQPEDGSIRPAADAVRRDQRTACHVDLDGWQGCFLVIEADKETPPGGCLLEETNLRDARAVVDDGSIEVSGLLPPEAAAAHATLRVLDIALTETQVRLEEDAHSTLPVTQLDGPWTFLPDGGQLDQVWKASLDSSVLELPVMRVRWEQEGQLQDGDWRSPLYDDKHWREVKVLDTRHPEDGALRYRSRWNARFISFHEYKSFDLDTFYSPKIGGKGLRCANTYILGPEAETGWLAVACESPFTVSVNGAEIGRGSGGGSPEVIELPAMRPGETELVITAEDSIALLAEGEWSNAYGASTSITTDRTWRVSLDGQDWREAWEYVGPPEASYGEPTHPKVLKTPGTLWYRCELPSGAVGVLPPEIEGDWKAWMDGMPLVFAKGEAPVPLSPLPHALALRVHLEDGQHGLVKPIRARCAPVETALGNWSAIGIEWYSGRVVYCTRFTLPGGQLPSNIRMELDLGRVCFNAEVWVNGILSGVRVWPPYRLDVTEQLRPGENELVVVVASLIANRMTWDIYDEVRANLQSRKWHETSTLRDGWCLESGLIGPVHLVPLRKVVLTKKVD